MYGVTDYVGKPVLKFYLGDKVGGATGDYLHKGEDWLVKGGGKTQTNPQKKEPPSPDGAQRENGEPQQQSSGFSFGSLFGTGANKEQGGGENAAKEKGPRGAGALFAGAGRTTRADEEGEAQEGGDRDPYDAREYAQRFWRDLGW
jgi:hypothetical protein